MRDNAFFFVRTGGRPGQTHEGQREEEVRKREAHPPFKILEGGQDGGVVGSEHVTFYIVLYIGVDGEPGSPWRTSDPVIIGEK